MIKSIIIVLIIIIILVKMIVSAIPNIILKILNLLINFILNNPNILLVSHIQYRNPIYEIIIRIPGKLPDFNIKSEIILILTELFKWVNIFSIIKNIISDTTSSLIIN